MELSFCLSSLFLLTLKLIIVYNAKEILTAYLAHGLTRHPCYLGIVLSLVACPRLELSWERSVYFMVESPKEGLAAEHTGRCLILCLFWLTDGAAASV